MKKNNFKIFIASILTFMIMFGFTINVKAENVYATTTLSYAINGSTTVGSEFEISINTSNITGLYGASVDFVYDPNSIKIIAVDKGNLFPNNVKIPVKNIGDGKLSIAITQVGNVEGITKTQGSLVIIKAKALNASTINLKTISANSELSLSGNTVRVKLADKNANKINYVSNNKSFNITNTQLTTLSAGSYEETSSAIRYTGNWTNHSDSKHSGGTMKYSYTKGNTIEFKFNGTGFDLYGMTNAARGKAKIYIDGTLVTTMDQYGSTTAYQKAAYSKTGLTSGTHTVKIEVLGEKQSVATGSNISIDKIVIKNEQSELTTLSAGSYEETNSAIRYTGNWTNHSDSKHSGGTMKYSYTKGNTIEFKFNGTGFDLYGMTNAARGKAKIYIDGTLVTTMDQYGSTTAYQKAAYSKTGLTSGTHTVKIEVLGEKQSVATGSNISIDKIVIKNEQSELTTLSAGSYEETNSAIRYTGNWTNHSDSKHSGGTMKYSYTKGNTIEFKFNGTGFDLYGMTNAARGKAKIYIDGTLVTTMDQYGSTTAYQKAAYSKTGLTSGTHTVKIEVLGEKQSVATGSNISIDKIVIKNEQSELTTLSAGSYEETNSAIRYTGNWTNHSDSKHSGGTMKYSYTKGNTIEFKFNGTGFDLYGMTNAARGKAKIYIDGTLVTTMDQYGSTTAYQKAAYSKTGLTSGTHTVKIEVLGEKQSVATGFNISIDKIVIKNEQSELTTLSAGSYEETNSAIRYTGNWTNHSDSKHSGGTMKYSYTKGNTIEFKFNGTGFDLYGMTNAARGKAKIYIDGTLVTTMDQYGSTTAYQKAAYSKTGLTSGTHTVKIEVLGEKQSVATGFNISIDKIVIKNEQSELTTLSAGSYEETNSAIRYTGNWTNHSDSKHSGGTMKYSYTKGNTIEFKFNGTGFDLYGMTNAARGKAKIYIDGTLVTTMDQYGSTTAYQKAAYSKTGLTSGTHTVKIEVLGEKQSVATGSNISIDKIVIKN